MAQRIKEKVLEKAAEAKERAVAFSKSENGRKWIITSTIALAVGLTAFLIIRKKIKERKSEKSVEKSAKELVEQEQKKNAATITETSAKTLASSLYNAMADIGTDETQIETIICSKLKNGTDYALVSQAFGTRDYGDLGAPNYSWLPSEKKDLYGWLLAECSSSLMQKIDNKLTSWGVTI